MLIVLKFLIPHHGVNELEMPQGARILKVGNQDEQIFVWAQCRQTQILEKRTFKTIHTGIEYSACEPLTYLDTVMMDNAQYIVHVFELRTNFGSK